MAKKHPDRDQERPESVTHTGRAPRPEGQQEDGDHDEVPGTDTKRERERNHREP